MEEDRAEDLGVTPADVVEVAVEVAGRASDALWSEALASADFGSAGFAFDAIGFFVALELLVLLGRSDLFVPTSYLFFSSTV